MANGKKSFVLYADLLKSVDHLTDDELGRLFKHILEYVNDLNPTMDDRLIMTAWKPIERTLKEDLKKWETQLEQRRQAGKKSAESRQRKSTSVNERKRASTDSVTVTVSDIIKTINSFKQPLFKSWVEYRKQIKKPITAISTLESLAKKINNEPLEKCKFVINNSIENGWQGLFWDKDEESKPNIIDPLVEKANELRRLNGL